MSPPDKKVTVSVRSMVVVLYLRIDMFPDEKEKKGFRGGRQLRYYPSSQSPLGEGQKHDWGGGRETETGPVGTCDLPEGESVLRPFSVHTETPGTAGETR